MVSFMERLERAKAEADAMERDPLRPVVERTVRSMEVVGTTALLDLIGLPPTTGNSRRIAYTMRSLGFIPLKSRRFMPGGHSGVVTRGWARAFRQLHATTRH
jgi:hypothetical protein